MTLPRPLKWIAGALLAPVVLGVVFVAIFGWNWLRGPMERMVMEKTGRALVIGGDIEVIYGWPSPRIHTGVVTFANPPWAKEKHMVSAGAAQFSIDLPQLLRQNIVLTEVKLARPVVYLERGTGGRKNWLLDRQQEDEGARMRIERLTLDHGTLGYDDEEAKTSLRSDLSTTNTQAGGTAGAGVVFSAQGKYKGLPFTARGSGGPVLALRDESSPYPLKVDATIGHTRARADGTITGLVKPTAMDLRLALSGDSLEQLVPLLGIAFPETRAYSAEGHLLHSANTWRYEKFSGVIGDSDIAGTLRIETGGKRPAMKADLVSKVLDFADLGPLIGVRPGSRQLSRKGEAPLTQEALASSRARVLPDIPFNTSRWKTADAEVTLKASTIRRAKALPLDDFVTHLSLRDSVLKLDPLDFGVAGGHLNGVISLDGREDPIRAHAQMRARKLLIAKLFPAADLSKSGVGQVNGEFDLSGKGNSVGRMLASSKGKVALVIASGEISKLMMEKAGVHLWEVLKLRVAGDKLVKLHCGVASFDVREGTMHASALIFDTEITTLSGSGTIDLGRETLDLTLKQKTKRFSPFALRSPVHVRGSFTKPEVSADTGRVATRALGAIALGAVNPLLALIPLIDAGPGKGSDCAQLVRDARALPPSEKSDPRS
ncbi:MAG: AsmA family protein [Burkholderiales bacterium]